MTAYTSEFSFYNGKRWARGYVEARVSSETDTTATIYWHIVCQQKSAALYGQVARCYVNGSYVGQCSGYLSSSTTYYSNVCSADGYATVSKTSSGRNVPVMIETRVQPVNDIGSVTTSWYYATENVWAKAITYYAPNAPSGCSATRNSDTKNTVSWTAPSTTTTKPASAILVERQIDGGSWSQIASVGGSTTSYADTGTSADHSYRYRVRAQNSAGTSGYSTSGAVYNTPAAPKKVTASRLAEAVVKLTIENTSRTATSLELQRSGDKAAWEDVATVEGSPVTETTDAPGGGTFYYRARNKRGKLISAWSEASEAVVTICPPAAPTLLSPASGAVVSKTEERVVFSWAHNPIDGSDQTAAQLRYSADGGASWTTVQIDGTADFYALDNDFAVNSEVTWGARTKGADADYGPWSGNRVFGVRQAPSIAFAAPGDGFVVENTPVAVELQYDDPSGSLASLKLTVLDGEGNAVYSRDMGTETSTSITTSDWVPDDGATYTLRAEARSSSSLTATAERSVSVDFELPMTAGVTVSFDAETGRAALSVYVVDDEELQPPDHVIVYRESGGRRVLLGDELAAGSAVVDAYAPVNVEYLYVVTSVADSGAVSTTSYPVVNRSTRWFLYYEGGVASAAYNPEYEIRLSRPNKRRVHYAGRRWPVSYDGGNVSDERSLSAVLLERGEAEAFMELVHAGGRCVFKSWDGDVFHADADVSLKQELTNPHVYGTVSLGIVRIDGGEL